MKKINPKYIIAAAIIAIVIIIVIIVGVSKGKDTQIDENNKTGTNIEETIESTESDKTGTDKTESSESAESAESAESTESTESTETSESSEETVEVVVQDIDPETGKPIEIVTNSDETLSPEEIKDKQEEIDNRNQEKLDEIRKDIEKNGDSVLETLPDEVKNKLNEDTTIKEIGNSDYLMNLGGIKVDLSDLDMLVDLNENPPMTAEEKEAGFKYWWIHNFISSDDSGAVAKVYSELHELKSLDYIKEDMMEIYPNFNSVVLTKDKEVTVEDTKEISYDNHNVVMYKYNTLDGYTIYNVYITPVYDKLNIGDDYRVYSISIKDIDSYADIKAKLENAINKMIGTNDFKFSL